MRFLQNHKDNYGGSCKPKNTTSQGFPYWGDGGESAPPAENLLIPPHQENPHSPKLLCPHSQPTKQQCLSYNLIKTAFLAVGIASALFLF